VFFDAALVNSHVLGIFRISGGVALRIAYGANGYFLLTVGGFHPSFHPGAMELPKLARVGVSVSLGPVWLKQEMYLAITSNTFQKKCKPAGRARTSRRLPGPVLRADGDAVVRACRGEG
jgi:hypothetical protein